MATCIVYFTHQGNTKAAAEVLAKQTKADLIELTEKVSYKGIIGFLRGGFRAATGALAKLDESLLKKISGYDTVVAASPVWAGKTTPAFNAVIANTALKGKKVFAVTVQADPSHAGHEDRVTTIKEKLKDVGAEFGGGFSISGAGPGKGVLPLDALEKQIADIKLV
ncbi:MAG: NAD(P)H-dependent oxidoreductase [Eubacteriales bacterium]